MRSDIVSFIDLFVYVIYFFKISWQEFAQVLSCHNLFCNVARCSKAMYTLMVVL